ncbi:MAG: hypothetical protein JNG89_06075 [Planctomycetaceae bacterium]|nr:hypothetical protein [Planctomycetaceae bacterium]
MFVIEDEIHADLHGEFASLEKAIEELKRRGEISWDTPPNRAPCSNSATCGREYVIVEYDDDWRELKRWKALEISATGVRWSEATTALFPHEAALIPSDDSKFRTTDNAQ